MNKRLIFAAFALAATLMSAGSALAFQAPAAKDTSKPATKAAAAPTPAPSEKDIADAKGRGLVWVNTSSKVYHKDGEFYGKTKHGKFMTEDDAQKAGFRAAKAPPDPKKKAVTK